MAVTINDYTLRGDGDKSWNRATDSFPANLSVGAGKHGLVVVGGFSDDERIMKTDPADVTEAIGTPHPYIDVMEGVAPLVAVVDTSVPYNFASHRGGGASNKRFKVMNATPPAIFGRVAIFVPSQDVASLLTRATALRSNGEKAMQKLVTKSYDPSTSVETDEDLQKLSYRYSTTQPFIDVWNTHSFVEMDVKKDDILVYAASDTSANADTIQVTTSDVTVQNLFDERYNNTYTDSFGNNRKVGSVLRVDRAKADGRIHTEFQDVTGAIQAYRLVPSIELVDAPSTSYTAFPSDDELAYFEVTIPVSATQQPVYPNWMTQLFDFTENQSGVGLVDNWPDQVIDRDDDNVPTLTTQKQIWGVKKSLMDFGLVPSGEAEVFDSRQDMENRRQLLNERL